jgi:hypothetical protein
MADKPEVTDAAVSAAASGLKKTTTVEKSTLPTAADIAAEKAGN